jgi:hypothetical protein
MSTLLNSKSYQVAAQKAKNMPVHSVEWGEGQFQKRKESDHFSVFKVFEDPEAAIQVDSVINIVYYMHKEGLKKTWIFWRPLIQWYLRNTLKKRSERWIWSPYTEYLYPQSM